MTLVGRSYSQRKSTPRHHGTPAPPLRDLTDDEYSELVDADAEHGYALLHGLTEASREGTGATPDAPRASTTHLPIAKALGASLDDLPALTGLDLESPGSTSLANPRRMGAGGRRDINEKERAA